MKYRIVESVNYYGRKTFTPQRKVWLFWIGFTDYSSVSYYNIEEAQEFINNEVMFKSSKDIIHDYVPQIKLSELEIDDSGKLVRKVKKPVLRAQYIKENKTKKVIK